MWPAHAPGECHVRDPWAVTARERRGRHGPRELTSYTQADPRGPDAMTTRTSNSTDVAGLKASRWRLDPARSELRFEIKTLWGAAPVRGRFADFHGALDLTGCPA